MQACIPQRTLTKRRNLVTILIRKCNGTFQAAKRAPRAELIDEYKRLHNRVVSLLHRGKKNVLIGANQC